MSTELLVTAKNLMALAKKEGAQDSAVNAWRSRDVETTWRDGKIEKIADATTRGLTLALYVDGRYGSITTSDLRPDALEKFVREGIAMTRALARDQYRKLPDASTYAGRVTKDLELHDPKIVELSADARLARAKALEEGARSVKDAARIVSVTTSINDSASEMVRVASNGFEGSYISTSISQEASVSVKDDDGRRPEDWEDASVRHLAELPDPVLTGKQATARAFARLGAKKAASGTMTIIVEARAARNLLRHFTNPLSGAAVQQKESFFEGKLGKKVASPILTLTDEPHLAGGLGSRPFDGEGMSTKTRAVVDKGVLGTFFFDVYYANKMGVQVTTARPANLVVGRGTKDLAGLLADAKNGILVTSFLGGNSNATTGVFSLGIVGFRFANGEKKEPISEMNISGNHLQFWNKLVATGTDTYVYSSTRSPSLVFEGVSVAGK
jgi:PmbA protein